MPARTTELTVKTKDGHPVADIKSKVDILSVRYQTPLGYHPEINRSRLGELKEKFHNNIIRTSIYCFSFILLGIHLSHGFNSSFKSIGVKTKYQSVR